MATINVATCTECGAAMEPLTKYIVGMWVDDEFNPHLDLTWACEHRPAADAPVRLASKACIESFCAKHPEYVEAIVALMSAYEKDCDHKPVN